jgi:hypothetical protein
MCAAIAHSVRYGSITVLLGLSLVSTVSAQSILDARRVEFTPSVDHSAVDSSGVAVVTRYTIDVFVAGGTTPVQSANLGKPAPGVDGMIRVDFVALLTSPLTPGVVYEALVEAEGPGGSSGGTRTNTFSFSLPCAAPTISPTSQSFTSAAGTGSSSVTAGIGCTWTAASNATWLAITAGATGTGSGTVSFSVSTNGATVSRTGTLTIAGVTFTVTQAAAPCAFSITPATGTSVPASGGSGMVTVATTTGCVWTASSAATWITISSGASGSGSGSTGFVAAANTGTTQRSGVLTIAGKTFTVTQAAPCAFTVSPQSVTAASAGSTGTIAVTTTASCAWSSSSPVSWITVTGSGPGNGSASYTIAANTGTTPRTATVTVAGKAVTVDQSVKPTAPSNVRIIK